MRITGDNPEGKLELDNFIDPHEAYPIIATTSKLHDHRRRRPDLQAHRARHRINSMTEFKQIIGRGTRIREDFGKTLSLRSWTFAMSPACFYDPEFDGEPVQVDEAGRRPLPAPRPAPDDDKRKRAQRATRAATSYTSTASRSRSWPSGCSTMTPTAAGHRVVHRL